MATAPNVHLEFTNRPDNSPEMNHYLGAQEMKRTAEIMQESARDFLVAAEKVKEATEVLTNAALSISQSVDRLELVLIEDRNKR